MTATSVAPLTITEVKPGLRVALTDLADTTGEETPRGFRGKVVSVRSGWVEVRFDDGVTRMCRAKTLTLDTAQVVALTSKAKPTAADLGRQLAYGRKTGTDALAAPRSTVSATPVGQSPAVRRVSPKTKETPARRVAKADKPGGPCLCSCGGAVKHGRSFLQGHDARFHGWMRRLADGRLKASEVPASALRLMNLDKDGVPTTDYDGSPWSL